MADVLTVQRRDKLGSAATRRLRQSGHVPAVLYGHGEANEHLAIPGDDVKMLLRHHSKTVELKGDIAETALVSMMQWDPLGIDVLHLDLIRVNLKERVEVTVSISVTGDAPGLREGGVLLENVHEVVITCPAGSIPDSLEIDVNELHLGEHLTAGDLKLPSDSELVTAADTTIVHIEQPRTEEPVAVEAGGEPEVIGEPKDDATDS